MSNITPQKRHAMIQEAAYFLAEKCGFEEGREESYWLLAEQEVAALLDQAGPQVIGDRSGHAVAPDATPSVAPRRRARAPATSLAPQTGTLTAEEARTGSRAKAGTKKKAVATAKP